MKLLEFTKRFPDEESCICHLKEQREKAGVVCSHCGGTHQRWDKYNTSTKKTFSALEMQRQLGHKRYQPIWEMMHKLRSVMELRDGKYTLNGVVELDEGFFTCGDKRKDGEDKEHLTPGLGSERNVSVLVMAESEPTVPQRKDRRRGRSATSR